MGVAMTDLSTGLYAYGSILAALIQRSKTGRGQHIDCNLLSTQVCFLLFDILYTFASSIFSLV